jgi:hypothetical protein
MSSIEKNKPFILDEIDLNIKGLFKEIKDLERIKNKIINSEYDSLVKETHQYLKVSERHLLARRKLYNIAEFKKEVPSYDLYNEENCDLIKHALDMEFTLEKEGWYHANIPPIPMKKNREKSNYFNETVFNYIKKRYHEMYHNEKMELPKFTDATLIYIHHLDKKSPFKSIPDVDNIDEKSVTDILASVIIVSDSMHHLDIINLSWLDDKASTEIFIMDHKDMEKWIPLGLQYFTKKSCL